MITAIIPTSTAKTDYLCWNMLSLALRSTGLKHVIVSINGPDSRQTDTQEQDKKELFLNKLKEISPFEISIVRSWSRVGFTQPIKICMPLIKTEYYVEMHDDVFILDKQWIQKGLSLLNEPGADIVIAWPKYKHLFFLNNEYLIFPRANTQFVMTRKHLTEWNEYFIQHPVNFQDFDQKQYDEFVNFHLQQNNFDKVLDVDEVFRFKEKCDEYRLANKEKLNKVQVHIPPGYSLFQNQCRFIPPKTISHLSGSSINPTVAENKIDLDEITNLENEILSSKYADLYKEFSEYPNHKRRKTVICKQGASPTPNNGLKILICLGVYKRYHMVKLWLDAYHKSNQCGSKLLIVHHVDDSTKISDSAVLSERSDWYVQKPNSGHHIGMVQYAMNLDIDWDVLLVSADDVLPINKDFIQKLTDPFKDPEVALTCPTTSNEEFLRIKTDAFCIRKDLCIKFQSTPITTFEDGHNFEYGANSVQNQILKMGLKVKSVENTMYNFSNNPQWELFEKEFPFVNVKSDFTLNIITPISRPELIPHLFKNICEKIFRQMNCIWHCIPDKSKIANPIKSLAPWMIVYDDYIEKNDNYGNYQRNVALKKIKEGWIYFLDDDNLFHPDFAHTVIQSVKNYPNAKVIIFSQLEKDGQIRLKSIDKPILKKIDTGSFIIKRDIINKYPCDVYHSDFLLLEDCYNRHPDGFVGIDEAVTYYNCLR